MPSLRTRIRSLRRTTNRKQFGIAAALDTLTATGGSLPGIGPIAGEAIDKVGGALQDEILGTTTPIDSKDPINNMKCVETASKHILTAMVAVGQDVPLPQAHDQDGQLVGYPPGAQAVIVDGKIVCPPGISPAPIPRGGHNGCKRVARCGALGQFCSRGMSDRYTGLTENPDPNA